MTHSLERQRVALVAIRGACLGALASGLPWGITIVMASAYGWWWLRDGTGQLLGALCAVPAAMVISHWVNGPSAVRFVPAQWVHTLALIGPMAGLGSIGAFVGQHWMGPLGAAQGAGMGWVAGAALGTLIAVPFASAMAREYRNEDQAAGRLALLALAVTSAVQLGLNLSLWQLLAA